MKMRQMVMLATGLCGALAVGVGYADAGNFHILHSFTGGATDGANPLGSLIQSGSTLYGMTSSGGSGGNGTIFSESTSGGNPTVLHSFTVIGADGANPLGSLIQSGPTLYGMTPVGGSADNGTIFSESTGGGNPKVLHSFTGTPSDGATPYGSLIQSGSGLYGMTLIGGSGSNNGMIFSESTGGGNPTVLHSFTGAPSDGAHPYYGSLIQSGSTLYGMTDSGGSSGYGTIFSYTGGTVTVLHSFTGSSVDGASPLGSLIQSGSTLYGMTSYGGSGSSSRGDGTIFSIDANGTGFRLLHSFTGGATDGAFPYGSLIQSGSTLYGMTSSGGSGSNNGTIFSIDANGTGFNVLHSFTGADGAHPYGSLIQSGSTLYGMTESGGSSNYYGTIFSITTPEPATLALLALGGLGLLMRRRHKESRKL